MLKRLKTLLRGGGFITSMVLFLKLSFSIIITKSTLNTLPNQNSNHFYSKITLLLNGRELKVKKKKARLVKEMIDFPKEFKFKLNGENVMDFELRVQIKKSSLLPMQRSK